MGVMVQVMVQVLMVLKMERIIKTEISNPNDNSHNKSKNNNESTIDNIEMMGGGLEKLIAPLGVNAFAATAVLVALDKLFNKRNMTKSQRGGELKKVINLLSKYKKSGGVKRKTTTKKKTVKR